MQRCGVVALVTAVLVGAGCTVHAGASAAEPGDRFPTAGDVVEQAYLDALDRTPDPGGLVGWRAELDAGAPPERVVDGVLRSPEGSALSAPLVRLYAAGLARLPDGTGYRDARRRLRSGTSTLTIAAGIVASPEARLAGVDDAEVVRQLYRRALGRQARPEDVSGWSSRIRSTSRGQVLLEIAESPEHRLRRTHQVEVYRTYQALLRRDPEARAVDHHSATLRRSGPGPSFVAAFTGSPEYLARFPRRPALGVTTVLGGLTIPWGLAFTPDGTMLVTERGGTLRARRPDGRTVVAAADWGDLRVEGEGGLLDLAVDPGFASSRRFYTCQAHRGPDEVQVVAWQMSADFTRAARTADPLVGGIALSTGRHSGCRLLAEPGRLLVATGDSAIGTVPQDRRSLGGKVLAVDPATGRGLPGNPFARDPDQRTQRLLTFGHRNPQGMARRPGTDQVWTAEHGTARDDEVNVVSPGGNYGWDPVPGYDESTAMTDTRKFPGAVRASWSSGSSTVATSGIAWLGSQWGAYQGYLAVATLKGSALRMQSFTADAQLLGERVELSGVAGRLRTAVIGPDDALYLTTSNGGGQDRVLRVAPIVPR